MKIDFFQTDNGMDLRAIGSGVYMIELKNCEKGVCLYVGESVWIASRCAVHLCELYKEPEYFGLLREDIENDKLTLKFTVIDKIEENKTGSGYGKYKKLELKGIKENRPLTQLDTSDRQIGNIEEKISKVQSELVKLGLK